MSMHPWVTIKGPGATSGVIQEMGKWIETSRYRLGVVRADTYTRQPGWLLALLSGWTPLTMIIGC